MRPDADPPVSRQLTALRGGRTPELAILAVIALLVVGALLAGGGDGKGSGARSVGAGARTLGGAGAGPKATGASPLPVRGVRRVSARHLRLVERRVQALRGLRFRHPVPVAVVTPSQARRAGLADARTSSGHLLANEEVLKLLDLLAPGDDERRIASAIYGEQVAGYYDPRTKRLALVRGAGVDDITLAHELTHALEDQHFDIQRIQRVRDDDGASAAQALVEGTATALMVEYALRYPDSTPSAGDALGALTQTTSGTKLPPYTMDTLLFPYVDGQRFVQTLLAASGDWRLVNVALRYRPPASTAQVIDPARWLRLEPALPVRLALGTRLGGGWRRLAGSTLGLQDTIELLRRTRPLTAAVHDAAGWRGGRYELWRRGPLPQAGCRAPCRREDALVLAWRMSDGATARTLSGATIQWLLHGIHARPPAGALDGSAWSLGGAGAVALHRSGTSVRVAFAPTGVLAARLVR